MAVERGNGMTPREYGNMRAAHADRERAVDVLKAAFAEGRLDQDEYATRVGQVYTSRTYAELAALTADVPAGPLGTYQPPAAVARRGVPQTNSLAVASLVCGAGQFVLFPLSTISAIVLGHTARRQIERTGEGGARLAAWGLALGYAGLTVLAFLIIALAVFVSHGHVTVVRPAPPGPPPP